MEISLCISNSEKPGKNTSIRSKLHPDSSLLVSGEKRGKVRSKPALQLRYHMQIKVLFARLWRG